MGLDGVVQCNCWRDHTASTPPTGWDDIYCDTDGWISSRRIDQAWQESDSHDVFRKRFGMLEDAIEEWRAHGCTHEDMEYCSEWISNWAGVAHFRSLIAQMGGTDRFQTLAQMFPDGNGGIFPARMASSALSDLDIFDAEYPLQ
ncbi:hypothetical protein [Bifidobacterium magnum]|uniref:Uncharacterized protein n=1 Tax=Bifidobacterium magnum TaxID=1692 RepID=A0A087B6C7_9BIFI|nr:hypothetical protein [Bifidobacterium magnum]KFI66577.1 hypothetical protein BMAGN_1486 [Bifidobacterium magnum]